MDGHRSKRSKLSHEEDSNSRVPITVQEGENGSDEESDCGSSSNVDDESGVVVERSHTVSVRFADAYPV